MKRQVTAACVATMLAATFTTASASIYGTLSNFDIYNETETEAHGAEIELEDIHISDINRTFPSNYDVKNIVEYDINGVKFGTRILFDQYNLDPSGFLAPTVGQSTNGHSCVNTAGCEHFGFSIRGVQPSAVRFYWLDINGNRIGNQPIAVPSPTWNFVPAAGGGNDQLEADIEVPEVINQKPDSVWMKVYKTEIDRAVDLAELMSENGIIPDGLGETETEWELLEGGKAKKAKGGIGNGKHAVIRRYEYFEYTGPYDVEHEPLSIFLDQDLPEPPVGELGQFIAANMVAANLIAPARTSGDYNGDGVVNAADYTLWRDSEGSEVEIEADGDDNGVIDADDLGVWQDAFGDLVGAGQAGGGGVPEPSTALLALLAASWAPVLRSRSRR